MLSLGIFISTKEIPDMRENKMIRNLMEEKKKRDDLLEGVQKMKVRE